MLPTHLAKFRSLVLVLIAMLFSGGISVEVLAKDQTPKQFLQAIYAPYSANGYGLRWRGPKTGQYFDESLTKLILRDMKESEGEIGRIAVDPFVFAQDFGISSLKIEILSQDMQRAKAVASFTNLSKPTRVLYDLVSTAQGWRIANIIWPEEGTDMRAILSGPMSGQ